MIKTIFRTINCFTLFLFFTLSGNFLYAASLGEVSIYQPEKNFTAYLEKDVRVLEKNPVILRPGQYLKSGDLYMIDAGAAKGSDHVYLELIIDWIEPLHLSAKVNEVRVAALLGSATAVLPDAAASDPPTPLKQGQLLPVGSKILVDSESCVGLDIGATHAICLTPGSVATIQRESVGGTDKIQIDLETGAVFSHVNLKKKPTDFRVVTPLAISAARGTDFVTVALPDVTDVWIQEGTVELLEPNGTSVGTVSSENGGSPKILRFPPTADEVARIRANTRTFTAAAALIPQLNVNLPKVRAKQAAGESLTPIEQSIVDNAQRMHALIKVVPLGSSE
ncbi:MAG: FecR domain-containing protein [Verrucomicrobiota bacterium]